MVAVDPPGALEMVQVPASEVTLYVFKLMVPPLEHCDGILLKDDTLPVEILRIFNQIEHETSSNGGA